MDHQSQAIGFAGSLACCSVSLLVCWYYLYDLYATQKISVSLKIFIVSVIFVIVNLLNMLALVIFWEFETSQLTLVGDLQNLATAIGVSSSILIVFMDIQIMEILIYVDGSGVTPLIVRYFKYYFSFIFIICFIPVLIFDFVDVFRPDLLTTYFDELSYNLTAAWVFVGGLYDLTQSMYFAFQIVRNIISKKNLSGGRTAATKAIVAIGAVFLLDIILFVEFTFTSGNQSDRFFVAESIAISSAIIPIHPIILQYMYKAIKEIFRNTVNKKKGGGGVNGGAPAKGKKSSKRTDAPILLQKVIDHTTVLEDENI